MTSTECLSITELNQVLNETVEREVGQVLFEGEISQITRPASGHLYFSLKDQLSQISAVMWRSSMARLKFTPEAGGRVVCNGRPNVYHKNGRLQIVVTSMEPAGEGDLRKRFLQLKARLEKDGFFAIDRKRPLPFFPGAIGIVTSQTGAVIHDMLVKLRERLPGVVVYLVDVRVQGPGAAEEIAAGVELLSASGLVDVIIVGRGGGSLEDLWPFNEEVVVQALFRAAVPVISAVGHEVDVTLSDLVADVRAPTPTAAAEIVVPHTKELLERLSQLEERLTNLERWFYPLVQIFEEYASRLQHRAISVVEGGQLRLERAAVQLQVLEPVRVVRLARERMGVAAGRLLQAWRRQLERSFSSWRECRLALRSNAPWPMINVRIGDLESTWGRGLVALERQLVSCAHGLEQYERRLERADPRRLLERGFAIVEKAGQVVRSVGELKIDDEVRVRLADGVFGASVSDKGVLND